MPPTKGPTKPVKSAKKVEEVSAPEPVDEVPAPVKKSTKKTEAVVEAPAPVKTSPKKDEPVVEAPVAVKKAPAKRAPKKVAEEDGSDNESAPVKKAPAKRAPKENTEPVENDVEAESAKQPRKREPMTVDRLIKRLKDESKDVQDEVDALAGQKVAHRSLLVKIRKTFDELVKWVTRLPKSGRRRATTADGEVKPRAINARSGLNRALKLKDAAAQFLGVAVGSTCTRSDLTKAICGYVRENQLQLAEKKSRFRLDDKLRTILPVQTIRDVRDKRAGGKKTVNYNFDEGMSYTELQIVLGDCFIPEPPAEKPVKVPKVKVPKEPKEPKAKAPAKKAPVKKVVEDEDSDSDDGSEAEIVSESDDD